MKPQWFMDKKKKNSERKTKTRPFTERANYELDVSSSKKAFLNLFGNGDDAMEKEFETESEEEEEAEAGYLTINTINFQCAECEFHTRFPNHMKEHMLKEQGQQRARIYSCPMSTKTFGVLKTI